MQLSRTKSTNLQSVNVVAQTFCRGVGVRSGEPRLGLGHPALRAVDHLLMLLKPRMNLSRKSLTPGKIQNSPEVIIRLNTDGS